MKKLRTLVPTILAVAILIAYYLISSSSNGGTSVTPTSTFVAGSQPPVRQTAVISNTGQSLGQRTKTSNCQAVNGLPDPACTPGAILETNPNKICQSGYASSVRNVPQSEKNKVYDEYGIASHSPGEYEVDHLISLELGGSNDISNLWPEAASPKPGFHEKDKVENYLHDQVCSGKMSLQEAQVQVANNWLAVYNQISQ